MELLFCAHIMSDKTRSAMQKTSSKQLNLLDKSSGLVHVDIEKVKREFGEIVTEKINVINISLLSEMERLRTEFMETLHSKTREVDQLRGEVDMLKKKLSILEDNLDGAEAYERRDSIIVSGGIPAEVSGENCVEIVRQIAKEKLKLEIATSDISTAHRIGKRPQAPHLKRNFIVKLCRRDIKSELISASKKQDKSGNRIYINESLTPQRNSIYHTLRRIKKEHPGVINGCTTVDGKVIVYTKPLTSAGNRDMRHIVNTREQLVCFCQEYIKVPLENFLVSWPNN